MQTIEETIRFNLETKPNCIINLKGIDLDTPIYRVYRFEYLMDIFYFNSDVLVKPEKWDDPFENLVFQQQAKLPNGESVSIEPIRNRFFGQCWTLNQEESDAQWRIYSSDKKGVRVKSTLRKLFDNFYNSTNSFADVSFYIGKVLYKTASCIKEELESENFLSKILSDYSGKSMVETLLIKRKEFEHENEVRLIYFSLDSISHNYSYPFNPNSVLEELLFDPRLDFEEFEMKKGKIKKIGCTIPIFKSELYQIPKLNLKIRQKHYPY